MKIILIGGPVVPDSMEHHVLDALREMGHEVRHYSGLTMSASSGPIRRLADGLLRLAVREPERLVERSLLQLVAQFQPELILVLLGNQLSPKTVAKIRAMCGVRLACWSQDALTSFGRQYLIGAEYDAVFVKDLYIQEFLTRFAGLRNVYYLPEACSPNVHRTVSLSSSEWPIYRADITTFGTLYYYRQAMLQALNGYEVKVWGSVPDWLDLRIPAMHAGRSVFGIDKCRAIAGAKVVLNTLHFAEVRGLNCRAFEIAGCGGFQLISYSPVIEEHFRVGEEIDVFRDRDELREKVAYYLSRDEERQRIAHAAQIRAYREHTYRNRLEDLLRLSMTR